ncbi:hypothetical protein [Sphingobium yanoikuyae]|uniref:hypothetical protein n=1 Tax=Sphingobium yanoikuyae TaxID=13690 RepID=UPI003F07E86B
MTDMSNAEFIRDLAARIFRNATPAMGFDQGDTDRLYVIANRLAALEQAGEPVAVDPARDRVIMASARLGKWMSAALDDPKVCDDMKADIREWFSAGEPVAGWLTTLQRLGQEFDAGEGRCGDKGLTLCQACSLPAHELTQSPGCGAPMQKPSAWAVDDEKVEVTQADRDMAADVLFHVDDDPFVDNIREGWEDDSYLVQAFARHRASHSATAEPVAE